jgi:hypothetical protein
MKKLLKRMVQRGGFDIVRATPKEKVEALIQKLHPRSIDKELIRIGPNADGGYLVPDDLDGITTCFSPGVGRISQFEQDCLNRGMKVFMADKSVDKPNLDVPADQYDFIKKHIGTVNNSEFTTMDQWVSTFPLNEDEDMLLEMDIEGAEYYSLLNMSDFLARRFRIMIIEFHTMHHLWNPYFFELAEAAFNKVLQTHTCVHIHPNNCCGIKYQNGVAIPRVIEMTLLRNDRVNIVNKRLEFPHKLDYDNYPNNPEKKHIVLPPNWYSVGQPVREPVAQ